MSFIRFIYPFYSIVGTTKPVAQFKQAIKKDRRKNERMKEWKTARMQECKNARMIEWKNEKINEKMKK